MGRALPLLDRRVAEEAVRRGMVAAIVMEAAAREWASAEGEESFPSYLVRREVLRGEQRGSLEETLRAEGPEVLPGPGDDGTGAGPRAPHPSEVVRGYRILERLGRGGMGSVYRAEQSGMNRIVALKILRRPLGQEEQQVERLRREARLVGSLDHPNIVRGLDVGQHGPYHYFAMEFVEGETLRDLLKRRGVLPEAEALRLLEQVALALDHAHSRAIVHRDVKPGNIIVTPDGTPKLTDYGLAKGPSDFALTQSGVTIGTPQYLSPEQAQDPVGVDIRTDLYSLGATAYHMLTGIPPHTSETFAGLLTKVLYEKPRTVRQVNPRVTAGASFLVEKLMAKQRRHRYQTPREALRDLRALAAGKSIVPRNWAGDFEVHEVRRKLRNAWAAGIALAIVAAAAVAYFQHRAEVQALALRETRAADALAAILAGERPRDHQGWLQRDVDLQAFLRNREYERTPALAEAEGERILVADYVQRWVEAERTIQQAASQAEDQGDFRGACATIDEVLPGFQKAGAFGREPLAELLSRRGAIKERGLASAGAAVRLALERAAGMKEGPGAAAQVEKHLAGERDRILRFLVPPEASRSVEDLDRVLEAIAEARDALLGSLYSPGAREDVARAVKGARFAGAAEQLGRVGESVEAETSLRNLLGQIPAPAAADLRGVVGRALAEVRAANREWLGGTLQKAREHADRGEFELALNLLQEAEDCSVPDAEFQDPVRELREVVTRARDRAEEESRARVAALFEAFLGDLARRDFASASRRLREEEPPPRGAAPDTRRTQALAAARGLLERIDRLAFEPFRARAKAGGAFAYGLKFDAEPIHLTVGAVRLQETETGPMVVFDAPNQPGLRRPLYHLSFPCICYYADLQPQGITLEQALVRGALAILDMEVAGPRDISLRELEGDRSLVQRAKDGIPGIDPAADALLARADALRTAAMEMQKDKEAEASKIYDEIQAALQARDPRGALRLVDSLLAGPLRGTEFVRARLSQVLSLKAAAEQMQKEERLKALFKHATISEAPPLPAGKGSLTRILWPFSDPAEVNDFRAPEGGPALWAVAAEGGLAFRAPEPGGDADGKPWSTADSPVAIDCPFQKDKYIAVSFTYRSDGPLCLQVSILGRHVAVLTDDGRRESGRGVFAWKSEDWRNADSQFPPEYRHDMVSKIPDPQKFRDPKGQKYFQLEPGVAYAVRVVWSDGHLRLVVNNQEIWDAPMVKYAREDPPRIRILTYTPGVIDDLALEGVVDEALLNPPLR